MKIGFIGLGRMGKNMVYNLLDHRQQVVAYNRSPKPIRDVMRRGAHGAFSIEELVSKLPKKKVVWLMVPAGKPVDMMIKQLTPHLKRGDIIVDGGNSFFKDSQRRHTTLKKKGISFLDCGTSGGMSGARHGACLMVGGDRTVFRTVEPVFKALAVKNGYGYMGKSGGGHFVKMVHNGIEYGMMAAIGEGMGALHKHQKKFGWDLKTIATVYSNGSIIESKLMGWTLDAMNDRSFGKLKGSLPVGETEKEMQQLEKLADVPVLKTARKMRVKSRKKPNFAGKIMAGQRNQFGGHKVILK